MRILSIVILYLLDDDMRQVVMIVNHAFQRLYAREINIVDKDVDIQDVAILVYLLEKVFPLTFMDIIL